MRRNKHHVSRLGIIATILFVITTQAHAQWRLKALSWNIESGDASLEWLKTEISQFEGYDIMALVEVDPTFAADLVTAAKEGEGAKGNWQADFDYVLSNTGYNQSLMIIWDNLRFERIAGPTELDHLNSATLSFRSPMFIQLRHRTNGTEFIVLVNHLARGDETLRNTQATGLVTWVKEQTLPVIALGDYNFDYDIDEGEGNAGFNLMTESGDWIWVRPESLMKSQASSAYNSLLDFAFVSHIPTNWSGYSSILPLYTPFTDDATTADHRPLDVTFYVFPTLETEPGPAVEE